MTDSRRDNALYGYISPAAMLSCAPMIGRHLSKGRTMSSSAATHVHEGAKLLGAINDNAKGSLCTRYSGAMLLRGCPPFNSLSQYRPIPLAS